MEAVEHLLEVLAAVSGLGGVLDHHGLRAVWHAALAASL